MKLFDWNYTKTLLATYSFRFKYMSPVLLRNPLISFIYMLLLIFILSLFYHLVLPFYQGIFNTYSKFLNMFFLESFYALFYSFVSVLCIYMFFNKSLNVKNAKYKLEYRNIFNLYSHLYTICFLLDILFIVVFKNLELTGAVKTTYIFISVFFSSFINILYPILYIKYAIKHNLDCSISTNKITKNKKNLLISNIKSLFKSFSNLLLLKHDFLLSQINVGLFKQFLSFALFSLSLSFLSLNSNPNVFDMDSGFLFVSYTFEEIFSYYLIFSMKWLSFLSIVVVCYWLYLKYIKLKDIYILNIFKVSLNISYVLTFLCVLDVYSSKLMANLFFKPSILPTQMNGLMLSALVVSSITIFCLVGIKDIMHKIPNLRIEPSPT